MPELHENEAPQIEKRACGNPLHAEFESAIQPHLTKLYRAARRILGSDDLAWDAVQDLLTKLWESGTLPPDESGRWLLRSVRNRSLDVLRQSKRRSRLEGTDAETEKEAEELETLGCRNDPTHRLRLAELREEIRAAVDRLPAEFRDVFELHHRTDRDYSEIGQELGLPAGTVGSRIHRAKALLREKLKPEWN